MGVPQGSPKGGLLSAGFIRKQAEQQNNPKNPVNPVQELLTNNKNEKLIIQWTQDDPGWTMSFQGYIQPPLYEKVARD